MNILDEIVARTRADVAERARRRPMARIAAEPSTRDFAAALRAPGLSVIAEYKPRAPSAGPLRANFDPGQIAAYDRAAAAISVLCDAPYFGGGYDLLAKVRGRTDRPLLAKDFVVSSYQIREARAAGADAILLIAAVLSQAQISEFAAEAKSLGMDAIVEVHDETELQVALRTGAPIIGVNSRNLQTMRTDLAHARRLLEAIPKGRVRVAESGIEDPRGLAKVRAVADAALVGTALMRAEDPEARIRSLVRYTEVKVCGVRTEAGARACLDAGVDLVGLNFVPGRRRAIEPAQAKLLRTKMPGVRAAGVFLDAPRSRIADIAADVELEVVQLHGSEPPSLCAELATQVPVLKALRIAEGFDPARVAAYRAAGARLLFDGPTPGEGRPFDPARLEGVDLREDFVAGGLTPENVQDVLQRLSPRGVDTASGVETDGAQDPLRIHAFVDAVRGAS